VSERFHIRRLRTVNDLLEHVDCFRRGHETLNELFELGDKRVPWDAFFGMTIDILSAQDEGHVFLVLDENENILGFSISRTDVSMFKPKAGLVIAVCLFKTITGLSKFVLNHIEKWAKSRDCKSITAYSPRFSGKSFALFEKRWGFKRWLVYYTKPL
jgi:hypothetical protein